MSESQAPIIGRLLSADTTGFVMGCRVNQLEVPSFGALVRAPLENDYQVYGLIHNIRIQDDGLVRQLVTAENVSEAVIADNRLNRNVPLEISALALGYQESERIYHLLPPRPPLSLDLFYLCNAGELRRFTGAGRFGYFRHILRAKDLPVGELLAAHIRQASAAHLSAGDSSWVNQATRELIILLRDDYQILMSVLSAIADNVHLQP